MSVHITTTSPVIIDDVVDEDRIRHGRGCLGANGSPLVCVDASALALELDCIIEEELASPFVIISPGRGGEDARSRSRVAMKASHLIIAPARRLWSPGNNPVVLAWPLETAQLLFLEVRTVLVLDDVVSSGQTMQRLCERNAWRFPRARWIGASWIRQHRTKQIKGFAALLSALTVEKSGNSFAPINSLSTLTQHPEIARSFAQRNLRDPESFLRTIGQ